MGFVRLASQSSARSPGYRDRYERVRNRRRPLVPSRAWRRSGLFPVRAGAAAVGERSAAGNAALNHGDWKAALALVEAIPAGDCRRPGKPELTNAAGEAYQVGGDRFWSGKQIRRQPAPLPDGGEPARTGRGRAARPGRRENDGRRPQTRGRRHGTAETNAVAATAGAASSPSRTACPEASFWQGICSFRLRQPTRPAPRFCHRPRARPASLFLDPALYLGMMHVRTGQYAEGIRFLAEANRVDAGCPFVILQMGMALVGVRRRHRHGRADPATGPRAAGLRLWARRRNGPGSRRFPKAIPTSAGWPPSTRSSARCSAAT